MPEAVALDRQPMSAGLEPALLKGVSIAFTVFVVGYILIPILVTLLMSFNDANMIRFPIGVWSLKWYRDFFGSAQFTGALINSLIVAIGTTIIATISGVLAAWAFERYPFPFRDAIYLMIMLPLFMPGVVLGLGVAIAFGGINIFGFQLY